MKLIDILFDLSPNLVFADANDDQWNVDSLAADRAPVDQSEYEGGRNSDGKLVIYRLDGSRKVPAFREL